MDDIEQKIIGLTEQDWRRARKDAEARVIQSLKRAIVARNNYANILDGFPATCEVIYQLKRSRTWIFKGQGRST
jgi:hypothetical protein